MKIVQVGSNKYIDQGLKDHINSIWLSYDITIKNDSNVLFTKNTTVNRLITDYGGTDIHRVIKKEKADYVVINRFELDNFPQFYDGNSISDDDTKEVVYGIYNHSIEIQDTIELILDFVTRGQVVEYVNQDKLNESLNNGFIIDKDNYITIKELVDSPHSDNHQMAMNMMVASDLKSNWKWLLYLYFGKRDQIPAYDKKNILKGYFNTLGIDLYATLSSLDSCITITYSEEDIRIRFIHMVREKFSKEISNFLQKTVGTGKFILNDFKLDLK